MTKFVFSHNLDVMEQWLELHKSIVGWSKPSGEKDETFFVEFYSCRLLEGLCRIDAESWLNYCQAVGWTVYGAVALSWCKDARLADVWAGWEASGFPLLPKPEFERPARFINPDLMAPLATISEIINAEHELHQCQATYTIAICARIVAAGEAFTFDLPYEKLIKAQPHISAFLKSRMLRVENRTDEQNKLIDVWSAKIKGTPYDIWADETPAKLVAAPISGESEAPVASTPLASISPTTGSTF